MNFLDLIILVPLIWCGIKGAKNGLVMEVLSLLALVAGVFVSLRFSHLVGQWFSIKGEYARIICFVIMFAGVAIGLYFLGRVLSHWANRSSLGLFNRIGQEQILTKEKRDGSLSFRFLERTTYQFWPIMQETIQTGIESAKDMSSGAVAGSAPWNRALDRVPLISGSKAVL